MNTSKNHRYKVLDSLRGVCACMVVLYHFHTVGRISNLALVRNSWMFVDFFFVLSGFVIATAYRKRIGSGFPIGSFIWLRIGRIYPLHVFVLGLFAAIQLMLLSKGASGNAFHDSMSVGGLMASLALIQTFVFPVGFVWNVPSWSIAVEMWIYLVFAILFRVFNSGNRLVVACAIVAVASCAYIARFDGGNMNDIYFGGIFRCAYGFAIGVISAEYCPQVQARARGFTWGKWRFTASLLEIGALCLVGVFIASVGTGPYSMLAPLTFLALILIFANEKGVVSFVLRSRFPLLLGELSYSIYIIHFFLLTRLSGLTQYVHGAGSQLYLVCNDVVKCSAMGSPMLADTLIVPVLIAVIGAAYLIHSYIESPCEKWAKQALLRWTQARLVASPVAMEPYGRDGWRRTDTATL